MDEDAISYFITEALKYHHKEIETLRQNYATFLEIAAINHNVEKYQELLKTVTEAGNYHKAKIREILHGQFDLS